MQPTGTTPQKSFWFLFACACLLCGCESHAPQPVVTMQRTRPGVTVEQSRQVPPAVKEYNKVVISLVQERWYQLLDKQKYSGSINGDVKVVFQLHSDGSVSDLLISNNTRDATLAEMAKSAVKDSAFPKWTEEIRKGIGADAREVTFKFFYRPAPARRVYGTNTVKIQGDAKSNAPTAKYSAQVIEAIQQRWQQLLDNRNYRGEVSGDALLAFQLHAEGNISDLCVVTNTVDLALAKLAESAIKDVAPFPKWPDEMRSKVGDDELKVSFTFFYNEPP